VGFLSGGGLDGERLKGCERRVLLVGRNSGIFPRNPPAPGAFLTSTTVVARGLGGVYVHVDHCGESAGFIAGGLKIPA
jgi:hypothetical protein